jgi:hypothetical protein
MVYSYIISQKNRGEETCNIVRVMLSYKYIKIKKTFITLNGVSSVHLLIDSHENKKNFVHVSAFVQRSF